MNRIRVSIAMASYNGGAFIGEQLNSFVQQQRLPDELVVCDDGSSDDTVEQLERFAKTAPFDVRIVRNEENLGYNRNFEKAMGLCSGDLILISDQDDIWFGNKISTLVALFEAHPDIDLIVNNQTIVTDGKPGSTIFENSRKFGFPDGYLTAGSCTSLRKSSLEIILPVFPAAAYDHWIGTMARFLQSKLLHEQSLQTYRRHGGNTSSPVLAADSPTWWSVMSRYGWKDPKPSWRNDLSILGACAGRIEQHQAAIREKKSAAVLGTAMALVREEIEFLETRLALASLPRVRRPLRVLKLWRRGHYKSLFGLKSIGKDLLRP